MSKEPVEMKLENAPSDQPILFDYTTLPVISDSEKVLLSVIGDLTSHNPSVLVIKVDGKSVLAITVEAAAELAHRMKEMVCE